MSQARSPVPDFGITNGRLVTPAGVATGTVLINDGRISAVADRLPVGVRALNATGCYVLPGLVDSHVHFRTPGLEHKEDWEHGSRAAVAGGVTTVVDMPNTVPPGLDEDAIAAKAASITGRSLVDFRFHIGADPSHPERLARLEPDIATSAKVFLAGHQTAPTVVRNADELEKIFAAAARSDVQLVLHAEDDFLFQLLACWRHRTGAARQSYDQQRPRSGGISAVARVLSLVARHGTKAHILHVSSAEEADLIAAGRAAGYPVTFEVTGHHLSFTQADALRFGTKMHVSPAIRTQADQDRLWAALHGGEVATLGSDHAPHTREEKARPLSNAPPGMPGVQELAPVIWTGMRRRWPEEHPDTAVARLVEHLAARPAALFGLPGKGRIAPGADADLVIFDPDQPWTLSGADLHAKCGWSPYEGWAMTGKVLTTIKSGQIAWQTDGGRFGEPLGRWLPAGRREAL
jgi:dihydroorotase